MADKCIGKLTLDISDVSKKIEDVNKFLGQIGANINLEDTLSKKIGNALKNIVNEAKKAGAETAKAMEGIAGAKGIEDANKKIADATKIWKEYYQLMTKSQNALNSGMMYKADFYYSEAQKLVKDVQALREKAEATKEVTRAMREYRAAQEASADKSYAAQRRETERIEKEEAAIEKAVRAAEMADQRKAESAEKAARREEEATARAANKEIEARQKTQAMYRNMFDQIDSKNLDMIIEKYERMADLATKAVTAYGNNDGRNANMYLQEAEAIYKELQGLEELYPELMKTAKASEEAHAAQIKLSAAINTVTNKQEAQDLQEREKAIMAYKDALVAMLTEQAKFNQQVASGKLVEGSERYTAAEEKLRHLESAAISAGQTLDQAGRDAAMGMQEVQTAIDNVNISIGAMNDAGQINYLTQAETAYKQLTTAVNNYNTAKKANNADAMNYWQGQMNAAISTVNAIEQILPLLNLEEDERARINSKLQEARTLIDAQQKGVVGTTGATGELESQVKGLVTRYLSLMAVIRAINNLIKNMTEYVTEYSDKMNEIQMITLKTDSEVAQLAETYRSIAKEMNVSSLDMADAAIYFTRQGLEAEEIEKRLKNVTMYAKAANVEFKDASEIITAVVNSMGLVEQEAEDGRNAAQRVSDVFLQIGDHAATSGQEIGEAMQKAAASAGAFGISMEWLASYIATVSETTRQEARTIGTAFNTIIARLHQIKSTGYNQEDETKVNDIAKALSKIDVVLMDQEGNWRDMEDILVDVASKWDGLDDKTKSYIATTMAGVKQQNVFLALMNDMSKGAENGSRAFELYNIAMDSTGVSAEKYSVYLDSVTAAQERLTIAQEEFYSILSEDVIKGWYNALAGVVEFITKATDAMGGLNIIIPIVAGAVILFGRGIASLAAQITIAGSASQYFATVWEAHPVLLVITGVAAAIMAITTAVGLFSKAVDNMSESFNKANTAISESQEKLTNYKKLQDDAGDMFDSLGDKARMSAKDLSEYNGLLDDLAEISPVAKRVVDELKAGLIDQKEAAEKLNEELERLIKNEEEVSTRNLLARYGNYQRDDVTPKNVASIVRSASSEGLLNYYGDYNTLFANIIKQNKGFYGEEFENFVNEKYNSYKGYDWDDAKIWQTVAEDVANKLFGSYEIPKPEQMMNVLEDEVLKEIDYVLSVIGKDLDSVEVMSLRRDLMNKIFGEDGQLDLDEYADFSDVIGNWVRYVLDNGTDSIIADISDLDLAKTIASTLFDPDEISADLFEVSEEMEAGFSRGFIDAYKKLVQSGFTQEEIKSIFSEIPQPYWNEAADILKTQMETAIKNAFGTDFLGVLTPLMGENGEYFGNAQDTLLWEELDLTTIKSILQMAEDGKITLDEVNRMMLEADGNVDAFTESLKNYKQEVGYSEEDTEDFGDALETMSDKVKKVKAGVKDIHALDAAIKDVRENGKDANLSDIFDLTEAHPELMTVIGDTEALLNMLQKIREQASGDQRGLLKSILFGDTGAMAGSKYAGSGIATLGEYRNSIIGDPDALAAFDAEVEQWLDVLMKANEDFKKAQKEEAAEAKEAAKSFSEAVKEVEKFDSVIKKIKDNKAVDFSDIIDLSTAHPELIAVSGDMNEVLKVLERLKAEAQETVRLKVESSVLTSDDWFKKSKFAGKNGATNAQGYRESLLAGGVTEEEAKELKALDDAIDESTANVVGLADAYANLEKSEKNATAAAKEEKNALKEAQKAFKENLSEVETLDKVIAKLQDNKKIDYSDIINLAEAHPEILNFVDDIDNELIPALERIKEQTKGKTKDDIKNIMMESEDYFKGTKYYDPESGITKMRDYITSLHESRGDWHAVAQEVDKAAQDFVDAAEASSTAADTWLDAQMKIAEVQDEVNWAKANNFEDQIRQLQAANEAGGIQDAIALFDSWDKEMQQAVGTEYPAFILQMVKARKAINEQGKETADLTQQTQALSVAMSNATRLNDAKYFKDSAKAIKQLSEGTISASDAYDVYTKDLNKVTKAYEDILDVQAKMEYNAKEVNKDNQQAIDAADVNNLATLLGLTTDEILTDFPAAVSMFDELTGATGELTDMLNMLNDAAFIRITGTSDADFSAIQAGLISVQDLADEAVKKLLATGQWETQVLDLPQTAAVWHPGSKETGGGYWTYDTVTAGATVLKPTGNNPFRGSSTVTKKADTKEKTGRSGGGGGGSSKDKNDNFRDKNTTTEVEKMLDLMSQVNAIQQYQQSYYQSQNKYYSTTGQLQGVIAYMQKEKEVLEGQNGTLESNIKRIEEYMSAKQAELASLSTEDKKYKEVADDFDKLQKAHQTYTKQLIDNKSAVESLNQAMEEQRKKIRQMEIDLRNLILGAIEDREKKRTDMLNAEIEMENTIYDLIVKRYEKERDEIIRTTDLKIDALNSERDLLEENLRIRKEEAEQEDKAAKLRELEVKYQRIIADPTRAKEAQQLKTEIDSLRKEMAWDLAEEEVKSQQDSIDQQIESLEDYKEYIENYYEDLFEHPQQLIAEMRDIMMGTQEEIINWLKQNDEAYRESSENTQLAMVTGWEETYNNMKGILKTYWDEVEEIIAQGDDYIIEFLKNNSADYAAAGKLQAEAYVDEWKKQLDDLHKAHQTVSTEIAGSYATIQQYNGNGSGNSSSNGGSSKGGGSSKTTTTTANITTSASGSHYYEFSAFGKNYSADKNSSGQYFANRGEAYSAAEQKINALYQSQKATLDRNGANAYGYNQLAQAYKTAKNSIRAYKTGGIADYTGPAWVDGSPQDPERILTPYQNKLFESFVKTLEKMATISIPSMPNFGALETTGANPVSVGDIIVNVDNLDTDDDYEEMADRVCEILTERIGRTAVVGGLRIRST